MAPFDGKYPTSYLMAIVMFAQTVHEIFANQEKYQNFFIENEGQGQRVEKLDFAKLEMFVFIRFSQNCMYLGIYVYAKGYTYTHTHTHTHTDNERQR